MALSFGKLLENIDRRIDSETFDEFRDHLEASIRCRGKSLQKEYYDRLLPLVLKYMEAFVSAAYANSAKYKI